jgi:uncharacterized protein YidB (DUF937 family)
MGIFSGLGGPGRRGGGMSPITMGILGLLAYRTLKGKGPLAGMLGTGGSAGNKGGGLLGGAAGGGTLSGGLQDLLDRFRQTGQESKAQSWVSTGANQPVSPNELEQALGEERLQWLMEQTGLPKDQLLAGLSNSLPEAVDELTPDGRIPTEDELDAKVSALNQSLQAEQPSGPKRSN